MLVLGIIITILVVAYQIIRYSETKMRIEALKNTFPVLQDVRTHILILKSWKEWKSSSEYPLTDQGGQPYRDILLTTAEYIKENKGAANDFNVLRDIAQSELAAEEEEVAAELATPLLIGLGGTFLGIILSLSPFIWTKAEDFEINNLMGGVAVAMGGSLAGLTFTLKQQANFAQAKRRRDRDFSRYLADLRRTLLPTLNAEARESGFDAFQQNISEFNLKFEGLLAKFQSVVSAFSEGTGNRISDLKRAIEAQLLLLDRLKEANPQQVTAEALTILEKVTRSVKELETFQGSLKELNAYTEQSTALVSAYNGFLQNDKRFAEGIDKFNNVYLGEQSQTAVRLLEMLSAHRETLDTALNKTHREIDNFGEEIKRYFDERNRQTETLLQNAKQDFERVANMIGDGMIEVEKRVKQVDFQAIQTTIKENSQSNAQIQTHINGLSKAVGELSASQTRIAQILASAGKRGSSSGGFWPIFVSTLTLAVLIAVLIALFSINKEIRLLRNAATQTESPPTQYNPRRR